MSFSSLRSLPLRWRWVLLAAVTWSAAWSLLWLVLALRFRHRDRNGQLATSRARARRRIEPLN